MNVTINDIKNVLISGVKVVFTDTLTPHQETYFEWTSFPIVTEFATNMIMAGFLQAWHHTPNFHEIEYHEDKEVFFFLNGTALMLFIDIKNGKPIMETAQIVRIPAGVQIEIEAQKGHFVAVAEGDVFQAVVYSPVQDAPRIALPDIVCSKA